ncbi:sigma-70 family RNA polymerase sigma factor [Phycicoccus sp. MAQZ13P-2]|uniref:sigma-70 family RNA polymerase sigma factor n=1 Tax=Phycicoccus mangrovi TaxID=2840470 RepID=UPI001BFFE7FB|nr:sigma-70 family RNA polymerase sigma factor [Phycicoccus mangrovi]MBT9257415.1 sigma-70 family RNA polymerase sigma factor [Phycicoccus mangrovi]MBT9275710.1 sigma-70 family RNA polymerase sigma factor [Phycicoccus mangrovi]
MSKTPRSTLPGERDHIVDCLLDRVAVTTDPDEQRRLRSQVVEEMLPLADGLARRYSGRGIDRDDLEQVARTALVAAADRYHPGSGAGFVAFAVPTITGELKRHFRDCGWVVRPPRRVQELRAEVVVAEESLRHRLGREATVAEIAELLKCECADVESARLCGSGFRPASLDAPVLAGGTEGDRLADPGDFVHRFEQHADLRLALDSLGEQDRRVVRLRFVEELTQSEIGSVLGVSQMQVSRILTRILRQLRGSLDAVAA